MGHKETISVYKRIRHGYPMRSYNSTFQVSKFTLKDRSTANKCIITATKNRRHLTKQILTFSNEGIARSKKPHIFCQCYKGSCHHQNMFAVLFCKKIICSQWDISLKTELSAAIMKIKWSCTVKNQLIILNIVNSSSLHFNPTPSITRKRNTAKLHPDQTTNMPVFFVDASYINEILFAQLALSIKYITLIYRSL